MSDAGGHEEAVVGIDPARDWRLPLAWAVDEAGKSSPVPPSTPSPWSWAVGARAVTRACDSDRSYTGCCTVRTVR